MKWCRSAELTRENGAWDKKPRLCAGKKQVGTNRRAGEKKCTGRPTNGGRLGSNRKRKEPVENGSIFKKKEEEWGGRKSSFETP